MTPLAKCSKLIFWGNHASCIHILLAGPHTHDNDDNDYINDICDIDDIDDDNECVDGDDDDINGDDDNNGTFCVFPPYN